MFYKNLFLLLAKLNMLGMFASDSGSGGSIDLDNVSVEDTQDPDAQRILDAIANGETDFEEAPADEDKNRLPSDEYSDEGEEEESQSDSDDEAELLAGKYKNIDELKKGIKNLKSELPDYVLDGMNESALVKHYEELNKNFSKGNKHLISDDKPKEEDKPDDKKSDKPDEAKTIPNDVWDELSNSFNEKGGLTQEQYDRLDGYGIPSQIVDGYLDGLVAKANERVQAMYDIAGGQEEFETIKQWAVENLDADYIESIQHMDIVQMKNATKGIKAQYDLANNNPQRIVGKKGSTGSVGSYKSQEDYLRDVEDRRYQNDENFRKRVDAKLARSKF